jgi:hypothetical protein
MSAFSFRPQVEQLDGRCLPSANPAISIGDAYVTEGDSGQTAIVFRVTLSQASSKQVSVDFATADGGARVGEDYAGQPTGKDYIGQAGRLTFAPGETTKTITVLVNGDTVVEGNESFSVNLSGASGAKVADAQGVGTILNDDVYPGTYPDPYTGLPIVPWPADPDPYAGEYL